MSLKDVSAIIFVSRSLQRNEQNLLTNDIITNTTEGKVSLEVLMLRETVRTRNCWMHKVCYSVWVRVSGNN